MPNLSGIESASGQDFSGIDPASGEDSSGIEPSSGEDESGIASGSGAGMFCLFWTNLRLFFWVYGGVVFSKWILK